MADNIEIFEQFYKEVKESLTIEYFIKEWGGVNITVPAFIGEYRDRAIWERYGQLKNMGEKHKHLTLSREFGLSSSKIRQTLRRYRGEVGLFANMAEDSDDERS